MTWSSQLAQPSAASYEVCNTIPKSPDVKTAAHFHILPRDVNDSVQKPFGQLSPPVEGGICSEKDGQLLQLPSGGKDVPCR